MPGTAPIDKFFAAVKNPLGHGTILSKPPKAKPVRAPKAKPVKPRKPLGPPGTKGPTARIAAPKPTAPPPGLKGPTRAPRVSAAPRGKKPISVRFPGAAPTHTTGKPFRGTKREIVPLPPEWGGSGWGHALTSISNQLVGPNITHLVTGHGGVSPWWLPVEAMGIIPGVGRIGRLGEAAAEGGRALRAGETVADAARAARVPRAARMRTIHLPGEDGGMNLHAKASKEPIPKLIEKGLDANARRVIRKGARQGLDVNQALQGRGVAARIARTHISALRKRAQFYVRVGDTANARMLANARLTDPEHLVLRQVARGVMPRVTIAANVKRIVAATKRGDMAAAERLRNENKLLPLTERYLHETGGTVRLRPGIDRSSRLVHEVWDQMVSEGQKSSESQIRQELAAMTRRPKEDAAAFADRQARRETELRAQYAARVHGPGRADLGATWRPGEEILPTGLREQKARVTSFQKQLDQSLARDAKQVKKGTVPQQVLGGKGDIRGATFMSTRSKNLRGALNKAEALLATAEKAHITRTGRNPADYYGKQAGLVGAEDFKGGNLYYPSAKELSAQGGTKGSYTTRSDLLPYAPKGESHQPFTAATQERGQESYKVAHLVGKKALARQSREMAMQDLGQIRRIALKGTVPVDAHGQLAKGWQAIRLTSENIPPHIMDNWRALSARLDENIALSASDAEELSKSLQELKDWHMPKNPDLGDETIGFVSKAFTSTLKDTRTYSPEEIQRLTTMLHNVSQVVKDMLVYTKFPGHIPPRLISNTLMALPDTGVDFARGLLAEVRLAKTRPDLSRWVTELGGSGYYRAYTTTAGRVSTSVEKMNTALVKPIELLADRGPRNAATLAMVMKHTGVRDFNGLVGELEKLRAAEPGSALGQARAMIAQDARQAAGEYERIGPIGQRLGNIIFLLRWIKAATVWTGRFVTKHPLMAAGLGYATSQYGYQPNNPIWSRFSIGGHNVQTSLPWSTPVEEGLRAGTLFQGSTPALGNAPLDVMNPAWLTAGGILAHRDLQTGTAYKGNAAIAGLKALGRQSPPGALAFGKGPFIARLEKMVGGNLVPTQPGASSSGGTPTPSTPLSGVRGTITPAQHAAIMQRIRAAERRVAAAERRRRRH